MKLKKKEKLMSWKETWNTNKRLLHMLHTQRPRMLRVCILLDIWNALTPYVGIYLSALIIEELAGRRNPDTLLRLVLTSLILAALIALAGAFLNRVHAVENAGFYYYSRKLLDDKLMDMDFCIMDETQTGSALTTILQNQGGGGWGMGRAFGLIDSLLSALFSLIGRASCRERV